jgi:hypothetical protein
MPNHITNIVKVTGRNAEKVLQSIASDSGRFCFTKILPMPKELDETTSPSQKAETNEEQRFKNELIKNYGHDNWYDWRIENWGTKWDAYHCDTIEEGDTETVFTTAWSTPVEIFIKLSKMHPNAVITVEHADEDIGHNCGIATYKNGKAKFKDMSVGKRKSKKDSIAFALKTKYGNTDLLEEYLDDSED